MTKTRNQKLSDKFMASESRRWEKESRKLLEDAAPDLLEICEALAMPHLEALIATTGLGKQLREAIAKARGFDVSKED